MQAGRQTAHYAGRQAMGAESLTCGMQVPEAVTGLQKLEELFLANNSLTALPPRMGLMAPTLRIVTVEGNMFRLIRR